GPKVVVAQTYDEQEEAQAVAREALRLVAEGDYRLGDIAILYRTNAQSRSLDEVLRRRGDPYRLIAGLPFYERRDVKHVLAYLRLIANPQETLSFSRIINVPRRKLGEKSLAQLGYWADAHGMSAWDSLSRLDEMDLTSAAKLALADFRDLINEVRAASLERRLVEVIDLLLLRSAYERYVKEGSAEGEERWANVLELRGLASEYDGLPPGEGLQAFLEDVALMSDVDTMDDRAQGMTLITLHMVKGLEFPIVFMLGMEEGLFPHSRSLDSPAGLEEERRVAGRHSRSQHGARPPGRGGSASGARRAGPAICAGRSRRPSGLGAGDRAQEHDDQDGRRNYREVRQGRHEDPGGQPRSDRQGV